MRSAAHAARIVWEAPISALAGATVITDAPARWRWPCGNGVAVPAWPSAPAGQGHGRRLGQGKPASAPTGPARAPASCRRYFERRLWGAAPLLLGFRVRFLRPPPASAITASVRLSGGSSPAVSPCTPL